MTISQDCELIERDCNGSLSRGDARGNYSEDDASCISQLAHCIRLLSYRPDVLLHKQGFQHQAMQEVNRSKISL